MSFFHPIHSRSQQNFVAHEKKKKEDKYVRINKEIKTSPRRQWFRITISHSHENCDLIDLS